MRYIRYGKYEGRLADAVNLGDLLDQLSDFLLDSGFTGGSRGLPFRAPGGPAPGDGDEGRRMEALREAILRALMESGKLTPEMVDALRGQGEADPEVLERIADLLDEIVRRLMEQGYLRSVTGPASGFPGAAEGRAGRAGEVDPATRYELTRKGVDLLSYRALRDLLGGRGRSSAGMHPTRELATGVEAEGGSRPYVFGDTLNLDVPATLLNAMGREGPGVPIRLEYRDLMVHQSTYHSSCATVLLLDCSHSMILYGEDRFTPAKKVALALSHLIRTQFPGDTLRCALFHDSAEEIPLGELARARVGPYHTNTAEGLALARRLLRAERKEMRQIVMVTDGKPSAMSLPDGRIYKNSMGLDRQILRATYREVAACRRDGISINTFMLARDPQLVGFVRKVGQICRGKAYFTSTLTLGQYVLMDYLRRTRRNLR